MTFTEQLLLERKRFAIRTNGVICAPLAGGIYWTALALASQLVSTDLWCLIAFAGSGTIFPLALALQKPTGSNMWIKDTPLTDPGTYAYANMALGWAIVIPAFHVSLELVPLALGVGMSLHLVGTAWSMNLKSYLYHPLIRAAVVVALWYALPDLRYLAIPIAVAFIYFATIPAVLKEVKAHKLTLQGSAEPSVATTRT